MVLGRSSAPLKHFSLSVQVYIAKSYAGYKF